VNEEFVFKLRVYIISAVGGLPAKYSILKYSVEFMDYTVQYIQREF
jgi:hypothetical protein